MVDAQLHLRMSLGTRSTYSGCSNGFSRQQDQKADQAPMPKNSRVSTAPESFKNRQVYCIEKETMIRTVLLRNPTRA